MNKELFQKTIKQVKETSPKRKFTQTIDLIINLKILNLKNPNENLDLFVTLPNPLKRKHKICAIVDKELASASKFFDKTIQQEELAGLRKNPKEIKKLSRQYDWFIAQANLMAEVATVFGKILGPRGKMPNPKAGCVITPTSNLEQVKEKLDKTVQVKTKKELIVKIPVGKEDQDDSKILENMMLLLIVSPILI